MRPRGTPPGGVPAQPAATPAARVAFSTGCTWWGRADQAVRDRCPTCGSLVKYGPSIDGFVEHQVAHGWGREIILWVRERCLPAHPAVILAARMSWEDGRRRGVRMAAGRVRAAMHGVDMITEQGLAEVLSALEREVG